MNSQTDNPSSSVPAVEVTHLLRRYGSHVALDSISLTIPRGVVYGLVGENGAGKTTLIKHILGLLKPQSGLVRVLGRDPVGDPVGVLGRIGYLSEDRNLPAWMRVGELLRYHRAFYPAWDAQYAETLRRQFDLDPETKLKNLSRGELAKAGLIVALAHRPELLVLDEPSSGLDPLARRDILEAIIRTVADEGRTVLFSSHLLDEIERVADSVAMLSAGKVLLCDSLDRVKESHHRLVIRFESHQERPPKLAGALSVTGRGQEWTVVCNGSLNELKAAATAAGGRIVEDNMPSLDEIFVARSGRKHPEMSSQS